LQRPASTTRRPPQQDATITEGKSRSYDSISPESRLASIQFSKSHPVFGGPDQNTEQAGACQPFFWPFSGRCDWVVTTVEVSRRLRHPV